MLYADFMRKKMRNISQYRTAVGYPCEFENPIEQVLHDYRIYGNTGGVGDKTKNLLPYPYTYTERELNGVKLTVNSDGTISASGTATANVVSFFKNDFELPAGTYFFSGCPKDGNKDTYSMTLQNDGGSAYTKLYWDVGNGIKATVEDGEHWWALIRIKPDANVDGLVFKPQIEEGTTATEYEPYGYKIPISNNGEPMQNIYIPSALQANEYADYKAQIIHKADGTSETAELPPITVPQGGISLTTNTTVPASKISVKYKGV